MAETTSSARETISFGPVIVTGGCGFIGAHVVEGVLAHDQKCQVHVVTRNVRDQIQDVEYHSCDISSLAEVQAVFDKVRPKVVFHVASPDPNIQQPAAFRKVNIDGSHNLLLAAKRVGTVQAFIYTSSSSVIHNDKTGSVDLDDSMPVLGPDAQTMTYSLTKGEAETEILAANRASGDDTMLTASIRPPVVFGERDWSCSGSIIENARQGRGHYQFGPGKNLTDVVYISNLVDAHILAAEALLDAYGKPPPPPEARVDGESFLIINEKPIPFWAFQRDIAASGGYPVKEDEILAIPLWLAYLGAVISEFLTWCITFGRKTPIISRHTLRATTIPRTFNGEKAKRVLGYKPNVTIEEGVARTGRWFREQDTKRSAEARKYV